MNLLITICARGGSKGVPGKNIKNIGGKPLIAYSIKRAFEFAELHNADVALSTDSEEIKSAAREFGLHTDYDRPETLATDTVGKVDVLKDVLEYQEETKVKKYDFVLDLDVTSPLRTLQDLTEAFELLQADGDANNLFSVSLARKSPYFSQVEDSGDGYMRMVKSVGDITARQQAPIVYDANASFYFYRRFFFEKGFQISVTPKTLTYVVPHICFDLDDADEFEYMSYLLENDKLDFEL